MLGLVLEECEQSHTIIGYSIELHNLGARVELYLVPGNVMVHEAAYTAAKRAAAAAAAQITLKEQAVMLNKKKGSVDSGVLGLV